MSYTMTSMPLSEVAEFEAANAGGEWMAQHRACRAIAASSLWWELLLNLLQILPACMVLCKNS